jgi:hypothetical protein
MYAVLHPSNFFAQAAAHRRPELRKRPFVVLDGEPPTEMVFAANHAARSQGVEIGMTRLQAETFSEVVALRRVLEHEHMAHATLHHVACMFSPRIESVEERPGTYALDIRGMDLLYGDVAELANKLLVDDELTRVDSQLIHSEVVRPALKLLNKPPFAGVQDEFLKAHEHYRKGDGKEVCEVA